MQGNQTNIYVNNCQTVVIGDHNDISQESTLVPGMFIYNKPEIISRREIKTMY